MEGGFAQRYRALASRDGRFDGHFVAGVHTTGIYCRPSCPATTPKRSSVRFYRTPAAAQDAGLRACRRCQPDAVPGVAGWDPRSELAAQAVRHIESGVVDREGIPGLAARVGYSPRQLSRILTEELGAGPLALARARRAQAARALLLGTTLPITDIAFAAGFGSVRQCRDTVTSVYGMAPSQLRGTEPIEHCGSRGRVPRARARPSLTVRLRAIAPFDRAGVLRYLADHAIAGLESVSDGVYERPLGPEAGNAHLRAWCDGDTVLAHLGLNTLADIDRAVAAVRTLFDLDADSPAIDRALGSSPALGELVARTPGIRIPGAQDRAETLVRTMIGQQVSIAAARTHLSRLVAALGDGAFPSAAAIAERGAEVLTGPRTRVDAIQRVAGAIADRSLDLDVGDSDALISRLTAHRGIGAWTAGYVAIRTLRAPDILLTSDLVVRASARRLGIANDPRGLAAAGAAWAPWRTYAGLHLWRSAADARAAADARTAATA